MASLPEMVPFEEMMPSGLIAIEPLATVMGPD